jgi:hypothetical protein
MVTYFEKVKSYSAVSITATDEGIDVPTFLEATEGVIALFGECSSPLPFPDLSSPPGLF